MLAHEVSTLPAEAHHITSGISADIRLEYDDQGQVVSDQDQLSAGSRTQPYDVIVVGSGGPGLCAALTARAEGAEVLLVEATSTIGGTTCFSGGQVWIPNNHLMLEKGTSDSREEALDYLRAVSPNRGGPNDEARWAAFVDHAPAMIRFLEAKSPLRFESNSYPDAFAELPGGKAGGRNLEAIPFNPGSMAGRRRELRYPISINRTNLPLTWEEVHELLDHTLRRFIKLAPRLLHRLLTRKLSGSRALVAGLYAGCLDAGVDVLLATRARELISRDGIVCGIRAEQAGKITALRAARGVILATGSFDWNPDLTREYLPGRIDYSSAVPSSLGDGLLMARQAGAKLAHMDEAWYWAGLRLRNYYYEGAPIGTLTSNLRSYPHTIVVNKKGKRFGNEASLNFGNDLQLTDPETGELANLPCWGIFDAQFRRRYGALEAGIHPLFPIPGWVRRYDTLDALAEAVGIDPSGLSETVERFNQSVRNGEDPDFRRGSSVYDRCYGAPDADQPNLGTIERPPFFAVELIASALGTKGGPMTNEKWQVLDENESPIEGLYAIGNVSDCLTYFSFSGGDTLGPGLTAGFVAAKAAASRAK
jgi:succinate dehydrogenase/fumarate reductase flavoprotein subunit